MNKKDILPTIISFIIILVFGIGSMLLSVFYIFSPLKGVCEQETHMALLFTVMFSALLVGEFIASALIIYLANTYFSVERRVEWRDQFENGKHKLDWLTRRVGDLMFSKLRVDTDS